MIDIIANPIVIERPPHADTLQILLALGASLFEIICWTAILSILTKKVKSSFIFSAVLNFTTLSLFWLAIYFSDGSWYFEAERIHIMIGEIYVTLFEGVTVWLYLNHLIKSPIRFSIFLSLILSLILNFISFLISCMAV